MAVIDVGKTNKKLFLFDQRYQIVWERTESFAETVDDDGDPCEDLTRLREWVLTAVREVLALSQFDVRALNFTAYGASLVYVDDDGQPVGHLYNYLKPFPASLRRQFYERYGPAGVLSVETASPALDSLNAGLMLYRVKHDKPALFERIRHALHLPQYLSYLITGRTLSDLTSVGCRTLLWDFTQNRYHDWVMAEGFDQLLGALFPADQAMTVPVGGAADRTLRVGVGLHDSSAALIPYLAYFREPFLLISTGTWCISLNPFGGADGSLTAEELQYDCLNYLTYRGQPVKAARLFAGYEHEQQTGRLAQHFGVPTDHYKQIRYNPALIDRLRQHSSGPARPDDGLIAPGVMPSLAESAFSARPLTAFPNYETAYHQLMHDIMAQQLVSTALVLPDSAANASPISRIFVDGGFSHNPLYMNLLAAAFPDAAVWGASVAQATALGAALALHDAWNPGPIPPNLITLTPYSNRVAAAG